MKTTFDYNKEQYRGTLKQIMKVRGLRTISIANYINWLNGFKGLNLPQSSVHSLKLDLQDGYINAYGWKGDRCGEKIDDFPADGYRYALAVVNDILELENQGKIPYNVRRNILVKMCR